MEGRDIKVVNTKYTNYRSADQSYQNSAIRAEATSLSLPWRISLFIIDRLKGWGFSNFHEKATIGMGWLQLQLRSVMIILRL